MNRQNRKNRRSATDVEKGLGEETLPAYDEGGRSPPYSEAQLAFTQTDRTPPGWGQHLLIQTSGLGIAMQEQSRNSLKYCLQALQWANSRVGGALTKLKDLLDSWNQQTTNGSSSSRSISESALAQQVAHLRAEVLQTLKSVVEVVSNYAGGALPENARNIVQRQLASLPQRFSAANARDHPNAETSSNATATSAQRVVVLAREGLDMMEQVSQVLSVTLESAESWLEKLGRKQPEQERQQQSLLTINEKDSNSEPTNSLHQEDVEMKM